MVANVRVVAAIAKVGIILSELVTERNENRDGTPRGTATFCPGVGVRWVEGDALGMKR